MNFCRLHIPCNQAPNLPPWYFLHPPLRSTTLPDPRGKSLCWLLAAWMGLFWFCTWYKNYHCTVYFLVSGSSTQHYICKNQHIVMNGQLFKCTFYDEEQESKCIEEIYCINCAFYLIYCRLAFIEQMLLLTSVSCLQVFLQELCVLLIMKLFAYTSTYFLLFPLSRRYKNQVPINVHANPGKYIIESRYGMHTLEINK